MKLYGVLVYGEYVDDGWEELGIFSSKEKAQKVVDKYNKGKNDVYRAHIHEYELDQEIED